MNSFIPRFQGRAIEIDGGWTFELHVSMLGEEEGILYQGNKIYPRKDDAIEGIKIAIHNAIKSLAQDHPELNFNPDNYIDMKTNSTRRWDKKDEN